MEGDNELVIHFGGELMTLFHVGYICEDLAKVIVLSNSKIDIFGTIGAAVFRDPLDLRRNDPRFALFLEQTRIDRVSPGSIEIAIAAGSWITSVMIPIVLYRAQVRASDKKRSDIALSVRCTNPRVIPLIDDYANGKFGDGARALDQLVRRLNAVGVSIRPDSRDVFVLFSIVERYAARIEKTLVVTRR